MFGLFGLVGSLLVQRRSLFHSFSFLIQEQYDLEQLGCLCFIPTLMEFVCLIAPNSPCASHAVRDEPLKCPLLPVLALRLRVAWNGQCCDNWTLGYRTLSGQRVFGLDLPKLSVLASNERLSRPFWPEDTFGPTGSCGIDVEEECYLVDPASSHMLVSKIKPCMCKYELIQTVKLRMAH